VSDQDQPAPGEPDFDDPAFDDLRGLLAETRVTEPVPAELAARLDATLAALHAEDRADADRPDATVIPLRRRLGRVLVAAAAIAVVAGGAVTVVQSARDGADDSVKAATASDADTEEKAAGADSLDADRTPAPVAASAVVELRSSDFARDAATAMRSLSLTAVGGDAPVQVTPAAPSPASTPADAPPADSGAEAQGYTALQAPPVTATPTPLTGRADLLRDAAACPGPVAPDSVILPATLDGAPVALVFRPPKASGQRVEAWSCDGSSLLAAADVPA
jgi:hypothetical protein